MFLIPSMSGGGAEKVTMLLANELIKCMWDVVLVLSKKEGPYLEKLDHKIRIHILPHKKISRNIFSIGSLLRKEAPSIFYTSMEYVNIVGGIAHMISKSKSKLVFSEHSNSITLLNSSGILLRKILLFGIRFTYPSADKIVCVSKGTEAALKQVAENLSNTAVIYNPIEQFEVKPASNSLNKFYSILSIGRLDKQKNFLLLIRAFQYFTEEFKVQAKLTIVGEGKERTNLENYINLHKLQEKVFLVGFQNPREYLLSSDVFVLPSIREGFGNVIVEALSTGIPVISTDCPSGPAEILGFGEFGQLVPINDYQEMARAIYRQYKAPNDAESIRKRVERAKKFSPSRVVVDYLDLFENLLQN